MSQETISTPVQTPEDLQAARQVELAGIYSKVATFAGSPDREFAAGPDIYKATGMNRERVLEAGYGSYGELEADALKWEADQAAREQEQTRRDIGADKEAAYQDEMNGYRSKRDATNERIAGISYRKKLEAGGEIGLKRNPELAKKIQEEAIAEAAAEGHSVGHLEKSHYPVSSNPAAEARAKEMAGLLRDFHSGKLEERHAFDKLQKDIAEDFPDAGKDEAKDFDTHADEALAMVSEEETIADISESEPITDTSEKGLRARAKRIFGRARAALGVLSGSFDDLIASSMIEQPRGRHEAPKAPLRKRAGKGIKSAYAAAGAAVTLGAGRTYEYFTDEEKGKRRKIVAAGVGAAVLLGTVYLASRGIGGSGDKSSTANDAANGHTGSTPGHTGGNHTGSGPSHNPGTGSGHHTGTGPKHPAQVPRTVRLSKGDTIWHEEQLNLVRHGVAHPTNEQVYKATEHALKLNGLTWEQARSLEVGEEIKL